MLACEEPHLRGADARAEARSVIPAVPPYAEKSLTRTRATCYISTTQGCKMPEPSVVSAIPSRLPSDESRRTCLDRLRSALRSRRRTIAGRWITAAARSRLADAITDSAGAQELAPAPATGQPGRGCTHASLEIAPPSVSITAGIDGSMPAIGTIASIAD